MAYATVAPAAAPRRVPINVLAAPLSVGFEAIAACDALTSADTLRTMLAAVVAIEAIDAIVGAIETTAGGIEGATGAGATVCLDAV